MNIQSRKQLDVTLSKLAMLEETVDIVQSAKTMSHADELTLESLSRRMNQLREEIARFHAHHPLASSEK